MVARYGAGDLLHEAGKNRAGAGFDSHIDTTGDHIPDGFFPVYRMCRLIDQILSDLVSVGLFLGIAPSLAAPAYSSAAEAPAMTT